MRHANAENVRIIRYLLGELPREEAEALEERYFANDELHAEMVAAEEELIDTYVQDRLPADRRRRFEARYLATSEDRERIAFAGSLARHIDSHPPNRPESGVSWWHGIAAYFRSRGFACKLAAAFAALAILILPLFLVQRSWLGKPASEVASETQKQSGKDPSSGRQTVPVLSLVLLPVQRSGEAGNVLEVPARDFTARLRMALEGDPYPAYQVTMSAPDGKEIHRFLNLKAAAGAREVAADMPGNLLQPGDYIVRLAGIPENGIAEEINAYAFRIVKRQPSTR